MGWTSFGLLLTRLLCQPILGFLVHPILVLRALFPLVPYLSTPSPAILRMYRPMDDRGLPVSPVVDRSVHPVLMGDLAAHPHHDETETVNLTVTATGRGIVIAIGTGNVTVNGDLTDVDHRLAHQAVALPLETVLPLTVNGNATTAVSETMTATATATTGSGFLYRFRLLTSAAVRGLLD